MAVEFKILQSGDEAVLEHVAPDVFDNPIDPALTREFLADPRHHIVVAVDDGLVVGFASGVDYVHPDKPAELWINEVGVASSHHGQGLGTALMRALLQVGRDHGCREAWVLTNVGNTAARALYVSVGGTEGADDSDDAAIGYSFRL